MVYTSGPGLEAVIDHSTCRLHEKVMDDLAAGRKPSVKPGELAGCTCATTIHWVSRLTNPMNPKLTGPA